MAKPFSGSVTNTGRLPGLDSTHWKRLVCAAVHAKHAVPHYSCRVGLRFDVGVCGGRLPRGAAQRCHSAAAVEGELAVGGEAESPVQPVDYSLLQGSDLLAGCEVHAAPLRVAVLLSGGVDSSTALTMLRAAGHHCRAFYLQIWFQEDFRNYWDECPWQEDLQYAQAVCDGMGVELSVVPMTREYWQLVVQHCIHEIKAGRTPNPDVLCNSRVKFGAFYSHLEQNYPGEFDRIASGHYAGVRRQACGDGDESAQLVLTPDDVKDQTYFLAHLSQQQLSRCMFPLGPLTKQQVRDIAQRAGLPTAVRKDSQGLCFLGKVKFNEFVREHLGTWPGCIVEHESNALLGYHDGFWFYTVGQRSGLLLSGGPWYVVRKDPKMNTVYVSREYYADDKCRNAFRCSHFNWLHDTPPQPSQPLFVKVRHGPSMYRCSFTLNDTGNEAVVKLDGNDQGLAAGQFAVFYQDGVCLGSAVMLGTMSV